jgi:DnaJ-class molecular chaperone
MTSTIPELDHYMVLGVERDATQDQIEDAYELAKTQDQIDIGDGGMGPARAADVESAYAVLRDPAKRSDYDKTLH